jgi:hypothetical protein
LTNFSGVSSVQTSVANNPVPITPEELTASDGNGGISGTAPASGQPVKVANLPIRFNPQAYSNGLLNKITPYGGLIRKPGTAIPALPSTLPNTPFATQTRVAAPFSPQRTGQSNLTTAFGAGRQILDVPGVPKLETSPPVATWGTVEKAFNNQTLARFNALTSEQQVIARTALYAAVAGLAEPLDSIHYIPPAQFASVVNNILAGAKAYRPPANLTGTGQAPQVVPRTTGTAGQLTGTGQRPQQPRVVAGGTELVGTGQRPQATIGNPTGTGTQVIPTTPKPDPNKPQFVGNPLPSEITAAQWQALTKGANGKQDPVLTQKVAQLLTDAREFADQVKSIDINRKNAQGLSPNEAWANYKRD